VDFIQYTKQAYDVTLCTAVFVHDAQLLKELFTVKRTCTEYRLRHVWL